MTKNTSDHSETNLWQVQPRQAHLAQGFESSDEEDQQDNRTGAVGNSEPNDAVPHLPPSKRVLPSADAAFCQILGPPDFLEPESIRGSASAYQIQKIAKVALTLLPKEEREEGAALKDAQEQDAGVVAASAVKYSSDAIPRLVPDGIKRTSALSVSEFLSKSNKTALPRKRQDRQEKEKDKRARGQSSHAGWKSDAEMVLRQQYD